MNPAPKLRIQINANFNLEAGCDRWDKFMEEVFPEDAKKKEGELGKADMLQQFLDTVCCLIAVFKKQCFYMALAPMERARRLIP